MARQYYYLVTGLPEIILDESKLSVSKDKFKEECSESLHPDDFKLINKLFYPVDNSNLYHTLLKTGKEFRKSGNISPDIMEEEIKNPDTLPSYMRQFIDTYKNNTPAVPDMSWENQLYYLFYEYVLKDGNPFIRSWYEFDLNIKNLLTGLNSRKHNIPMEKEIIDVNFTAEAIKRSNAGDFGLARELPYLEKLIHSFEDPNLVEREKGIDNIKWDFLDEAITFEYFSIEVIMSFMIKLGIAERWLKLEKETGKEFFEKILKELESSYEFPEEFILTGGKKK